LLLPGSGLIEFISLTLLAGDLAKMSVQNKTQHELRGAGESPGGVGVGVYKTRRLLKVPVQNRCSLTGERVTPQPSPTAITGGDPTLQAPMPVSFLGGNRGAVG